MKIKLAVLTMACTLFSIGSVTAAEQTAPNQPANTAAEQTAPNPVTGFGGGTGMGPGGSAGSASSLNGGFGSSASSSGAGSQTFGGGLPGTGPLSTPPAAGAGGGAMRPL